MSEDDDDPLWDQYEGGFKKKTKPFTVVGDNRSLLLRPARLPAPETIPPRPWLYGTQILRGYFSVLVAPGGVGKTGYAMGVALAAACGKPLFGDKVFERVNVVVFNLEDPMDELERRLAALMLHHNIDRSEIEGRYFLYSTSSEDRRLTIAAPSPDGFEIVHPDEAAVIREVQEHNIGLVVVDPFAESHELEENSNPQMNKAAAAWRRISRATGCGILLLHHVRKGVATDIDAARGAKSLTDSARVGLVMCAMTEEEAEGFDIEAKDRTSYVRLDDAKSNMARKAGVARWFELVTIELHNTSKAYPAGDHVAAIARWKPPSVMGDLTIVQCNEALDAIDRGPRAGVRFTHTRAGNTNRWAGQALMELFGVSQNRAQRIIGDWVKNGVLEVKDYEDAEQRKKRSGTFVNALKRPGTVPSTGPP